MTKRFSRATWSYKVVNKAVAAKYEALTSYQLLFSFAESCLWAWYKTATSVKN